MDSVGLSRLKELEKDRLKAGEQHVTTETVTATIKQRKRVSFTILGHNNKDNGSSSSIRRSGSSSLQQQATMSSSSSQNNGRPGSSGRGNKY